MRPYPASPFWASSRVRFSCRGALKSPVPTHEPVHLPAMLAVDDALGAGATGSGALLGAGALAAGALEAGVLAAGSVVTDGMVVPLVAAVVVPSAGAPVLSGVPAAVSVPGGVSTGVADGSDVVKMEHAARRGIMASQHRAHIPLTQTFHGCHRHVLRQTQRHRRRNLETDCAGASYESRDRNRRTRRRVAGRATGSSRSAAGRPGRSPLAR
jgi:hypothetical protein